MNATRAAVEEGIVIGGGAALLNAARVLAKLQPDNDDQRVGVEIVARALQAPIRQIAENAGHEGSIVVGKINDAKDPAIGFDAQNEVGRGSCKERVGETVWIPVVAVT